MTSFITGGRGFIGAQLALELARQGERVVLLNRPGSELPSFLKEEGNIECREGDILDQTSLNKAAQGCDRVFHLAALAKPWSKKKSDFYDVNVTGTLNVLEAAKKSNIKTVVVTSSAGTFGPQRGYNLVHEAKPQHRPFFTEYERTKDLSVRKALEQYGEQMKIVVVSPTRVFGPGALSVSNAVTKLIIQYALGKFKFLPGNGHSMGNYAFIDDVVQGHIAAAEKGFHGENYILGGPNLTYRAFFDAVGEVTGKKHNMFTVPVFIIVGASYLLKWTADVTGVPPKITPGFAKKYVHDWGIDLSKARKHLGYTVTPIHDAVKRTLDYAKKEGLL